MRESIRPRSASGCQALAILRCSTSREKYSSMDRTSSWSMRILQVKPFQQPHIDIVASTISPSGWSRRDSWMWRAVGRSYAPRSGRSDEAMGDGGRVGGETTRRSIAKNCGWFPDSSRETREQAMNDIRDGANAWIREYFIDTLGAPAVRGVSESAGRRDEHRSDEWRGVSSWNTRRRDREDQELQQATGGSAASWARARVDHARKDAALVRAVRALRRPAIPGRSHRRRQILERMARENRDLMFTKAVQES